MRPRVMNTPPGLWTIVLEISVLMAQFPSKEIAQRSYDLSATLASAMPMSAALLMSSRHSL